MMLQQSVSLITLLKVGGKVMSVIENHCALLQLSNGWNTDVSKTEDEAIVILYCKKDEFAKQMQSCTRYLAVSNPNKADTDSLLQCLEEVFKILYRYKMFILIPKFWKPSHYWLEEVLMVHQ